MTREDAIEEIKYIQLASNKRVSEALDMAISALEQICDNDCEHCTWTECPIDERVKSELKVELNELEPCEDAVSRDAVLNTLDNMDKALDEDRTVENYKTLLKECYEMLPSVTVCDIEQYAKEHNLFICTTNILEQLRNDIKHMQYLTATEEYAKGYKACQDKVLWYIDRYLKGEKK